ncbi:MAG: hypothetical protein HYT87_07420 [Nitrospirae bacterium]|nr:hypothetical protein [Nitrospirota bacterium]
MLNNRVRFQIVAAALAALAVIPSKAFSWGTAHSHMTETVAEAGLQGLDRGLYAPLLGDLAVWADGKEPEDFKGTLGIDEEINPPPDLRLGGADPDHWLDIFNLDHGLQPQGVAQMDFALFIGNAKKAFESGDKEKGFLLLGRGIHYLEDIGMPYHVVLWENLDFLHGHSAYESWADGQWDALQLASWVRDGTQFSSEIKITDPANLVIEMARISRPYLDRIKGGKWTSDTKATQELMFSLGQRIAATFSYVAPEQFTFPKPSSGKNGGNTGTTPSTPPAGAGGCSMVDFASPVSFGGLGLLLFPAAYFLRRRSSVRS